MEHNEVRFSGHALRQMVARRISREEVLSVLKDGRAIMDYPDDRPYPSRLLLAFVMNGRFTPWLHTMKRTAQPTW